MDITEKAKAYADGKALSAITTAIEEAYAAGYKDGYNDGMSSRDNLSPNDIEEGVEYADLGLPSGTKWAIDFLKDEKGKVKLFYYEEARNYNLPTSQQYLEFINNTRRSDYVNNQGEKTIKILGANGNRMQWEKYMSTVAEFSASKFMYMFWLKNMEENGSERIAAKDSKIVNIFTGYRLPIILVR